MANFGNRSDAITIIRADISTFLGSYRTLDSDISIARDFDYFDTGLAAGIAPFVNGDFTGTNADILTASAFYTDLVQLAAITTLFTAARRKALSRLSPR
jgi:hypothetical protein